MKSVPDLRCAVCAEMGACFDNQTTQTESQDQDEFEVTEELKAERISFSKTQHGTDRAYDETTSLRGVGRVGSQGARLGREEKRVRLSLDRESPVRSVRSDAETVVVEYTNHTFFFEMENMEINTPSTRSKSRANPSLYEKIIRNNNSNNLNQKSDKKNNTRVSFEDVIKIEMNDTPGVEGQLYFQYIYS
jgi:hypothetical protein